MTRKEEAVKFYNSIDWKKKYLDFAEPFLPSLHPHSPSRRACFAVRVLSTRSSAEYEFLFLNNFASQLTFCYLIVLNSTPELSRLIWDIECRTETKWHVEMDWSVDVEGIWHGHGQLPLVLKLLEILHWRNGSIWIWNASCWEGRGFGIHWLIPRAATSNETGTRERGLLIILYVLLWISWFCSWPQNIVPLLG